MCAEFCWGRVQGYNIGVMCEPSSCSCVLNGLETTKDDLCKAAESKP